MKGVLVPGVVVVGLVLGLLHLAGGPPVAGGEGAVGTGGALPATLPTPTASPEPRRPLVPSGREAPRGTLGFHHWFTRAVVRFRGGGVGVGSCRSGVDPGRTPAVERSRALLRRAGQVEGAGGMALAELRSALAALAGAGRPGPGRPVAEAWARTHGNVLARLQCSALLVRWELARLGAAEPRPRPRHSPLTLYVREVIGLVLIDATAARLVLTLLTEKEQAPGERHRYLRGAHRDLVAGMLPGQEGCPWLAPVARILHRTLLANMVALGELTPRELAAAVSAAAGVADIGVPHSSPAVEEAFAATWHRLGRLPRDRAYEERRRLATVLGETVPDLERALRIMDTFYTGYPHFATLGPQAWPNQAWKPGGVERICTWIRRRWCDPRYGMAVVDALQGLIRSQGVLDGNGRDRVAGFLAETWNAEGVSPGLRVQALRALPSCTGLATDRVRRILLAAWEVYEGSSDSEFLDSLLYAIRAFLQRPGRPPAPALRERLHTLHRDPGLDPEQAARVAGVLREFPTPGRGGGAGVMGGR